MRYIRFALGITLALTIFGQPAISSGADTVAVEFFVATVPGVSCVIEGSSTAGSPAEAYCQDLGERYSQTARLDTSGGVVACHEHGYGASCDLGNPGEHTPRFAYGRKVARGPFRCQILHTAVKCTVLATGKGFTMSSKKVLAVGGASVRPAPLHLSDFLSPDRKVWCGIGEGRGGFCATGGYDPSAAEPQGLASFGKGGTVTICFVPAPTASQGCIQNWDTQAPILGYGRQSEQEGVLCTSASNGITCTLVAGAGEGKGFRVNKGEAVRVG